MCIDSAAGVLRRCHRCVGESSCCTVLLWSSKQFFGLSVGSEETFVFMSISGRTILSRPDRAMSFDFHHGRYAKRCVFWSKILFSGVESPTVHASGTLFIL